MVAVFQGLGVDQYNHFKNLLINPDGRFNQRAPATNADDTYGHDRWNALTQTNTIAVSTVSDAENGTPRMWRLTQSQAVAQRMGYSQIIEGVNCRHLRGKSVTLSGRINFSLNAAVRYAILEWTSTEDAVTSDVVLDWTSSTYTANNFFLASNLTITGTGTITPSAATLTDITPLTVTLGSSFNNLVILIWTSGTAAQNATLDGALQLEEGLLATARALRPVQMEQNLCFRYCHLYTVPPLRGVVAGGGNSGARMAMPISPPMRAAPTATLGANLPIYDGVGTTTVSSIATSYLSAETAEFDLNLAGAATLGNPAMVYQTGSVTLRLDAEL